MDILATDLDRTLLPNGRWPSDPGAIELFNALTRHSGLQVVYVTGRSLDLTEQAIEEFGVRHPDVLIGDVGTTIRRFENGTWHPYAGWAEHVRRACPRWDAEDVRASMRGIAHTEEQERVHCGPFKQSYYVDHAQREDVLAEVERVFGGRFDEVAIYSFDSQSGKGLLDLLPRSATKQTALEYLAQALEVPRGDVVFCGDSGNDLFPLTAGFSGVMVRNADEQLVEGVRQAVAGDPSLRVYHARGGYRGLNGYYTGGVLEGAHHYGILGEAD
jgi:sucrose-6F-phosphate phosphohydrolase